MGARWRGRGFDEVLLLGEEVVRHVGEGRVGGAEAGGEEILQCAGDLVGYDGGDHGDGRSGDLVMGAMVA